MTHLTRGETDGREEHLSRFLREAPGCTSAQTSEFGRVLCCPVCGTEDIWVDEAQEWDADQWDTDGRLIILRVWCKHDHRFSLQFGRHQRALHLCITHIEGVRQTGGDGT